MTQTMNGKPNNTPPPSKQRKPGQRQQERQIRLQRRRQRQRIWLSILAIVIILAIGGVTFWQYQRITGQHPTASAAHKKTTHAATATKAAQVGPNCSVASSVPPIYQSVPTAGPSSPPQIMGQPATNPDGLQCIDIKVGVGQPATANSQVEVQYTGWLAANGKKFDSSYDRKQPLQVSLGQGQVIPGWDEGIVGMKHGGIRRLIIPASLAYGAAGQPPTIPANAVLIFDITMVSV
jgi:FKBP-type peptidyl-prolyl cis-trans isomerase FkpA